MTNGAYAVIALVLGAWGPFLYGQDPASPACSFEIRVMLPNGQPIPGDIPIRVVNANGKVVAETIAKNGAARICGLPYGPHDFVMIDSVCGETILKSVVDPYPKKSTLSVILNRCPSPFGNAGRGCFHRLHFVDSLGAPEEGIECRDQNNKLTVSDEFGRMIVSTSAETTLTVRCQRKAENNNNSSTSKVTLEFKCENYFWSIMQVTVPQ